MSVTVRLADGFEDTNVLAADFSYDEEMGLTLLDKPVDDETAKEIAVYVPGSWIRARVDAPAG